MRHLLATLALLLTACGGGDDCTTATVMQTPELVETPDGTLRLPGKFTEAEVCAD